MTRLKETQIELLLGFRQTHNEGLKSAPYYVPFGVSPLRLGGAGQALVGLLRRGFVEERDNLYYITDTGLAALAEHVA